MIVLTGGAGFIGSAFLGKLNAQGVFDIIVVDELDESVKWKNLSNKQFFDYVPKHQFYSLVERDALPASISAIVHLGACTSTTEQNADYMMDTNYRATRLLAELALKHKLRFIYASSAATYGLGTHGFSDADEVTLTLIPQNIYGLSKQLFDAWAIRSQAIKHLIGLKFFNVYGPNEYHKGDMSSVVLKAFMQIKEKGVVRLFKSTDPQYPDGGQKRDFIYVKDCSEVLWWLLESGNVSGGIFNLGTGSARTWNELAGAVFDALGTQCKIDYISMPETLRPAYQNFTEARIEKLRQAGYTKPFTTLEAGVREYVQEYLDKGSCCL